MSTATEDLDPFFQILHHNITLPQPSPLSTKHCTDVLHIIMAAAKMLDDPDHINTFLSMIGASPMAPKFTKTVRDGENENPLAEESKLGLGDSKFAAKSGLSYPVVEYKPGMMTSTSYHQRTPGHTEFTASTFPPKNKKDMVIDQPPKGYIDHVVSEFQKQHIDNFKKDYGALKEQDQAHNRDFVTANITTQKTLLPSNSGYEAVTPSKPVEKVSQDVNTAENKNSMTSSVAAEVDSSSNNAQEAAIITAESKIADVEEDREYPKHFKSWGKPEARDSR